MKYAIIDENRSLPFPKAKGICPSCRNPMQAKCGTKVIWHWAHVSRKHCDPWWENETEWHREWKSFYPEDWQEVVLFDSKTNEKHIADVKTENGLVLEFQNSPISVEELISREIFYENMVWIVNAEKFIKNFHVLHKLPDPKSSFAQDLVFFASKHTDKGRGFYRKSENPKQAKFVQIHSVDTIKEELEDHYIGHHVFDWVRPRAVWYDANTRVLFDFGNSLLWELVEYHAGRLLSVLKIEKSAFIEETRGII